MPELKPQIYVFDDFRLDVSIKRLLHGGRPVALASKAFDRLAVLAGWGGRLNGKGGTEDGALFAARGEGLF